MESTLVEPDVLQRVLGEAMARGGEFAEVFVEDRSTSSAMLDQRRIEELSSGRDRGAGIRVVVGETTGFAHTADLSERGLLAAAQAAATVARKGGGGVREIALGPLTNHPTIATMLPGDVDKARKIELMNLADDAARSEGSSITQVSVALGDSSRRHADRLSSHRRNAWLRTPKWRGSGRRGAWCGPSSNHEARRAPGAER
jgi:TldD protein